MKKKPAKKKATKRPSQSKPEPKSKPVAEPEAQKPVAPAPKPARSRQTRTIDKRAAFLAAYGIAASIDAACKAAKIDRKQHYRWLKGDADYAARFRDVKTEAADALEDEAVERAMRGVYEPNVFQGRFIYPQEEVVTPAVLGPRGGIVEPERREWRDVPGAMPFGIWRKSDTLLIHLLRGFMPEKYGYRGQFELSGPAGGPMEIVERLNAGRARVAAAKAGADE